MTSMLQRRTLLASAGAVLSARSGAVWAQAYPNRPIRLIVPFAPGGITGIVARVVAENGTASLRDAAGDSLVKRRRPRPGYQHHVEPFSQ